MVLAIQQYVLALHPGNQGEALGQYGNLPFARFGSLARSCLSKGCLFGSARVGADLKLVDIHHDGSAKTFFQSLGHFRICVGIEVRGKDAGRHGQRFGIPVHDRLFDPCPVGEGRSDLLIDDTLAVGLPRDGSQGESERDRQHYEDHCDPERLETGLAMAQIGLEAVEPGHDRCGQADGHEVGYEQAECACKYRPVEGCQTEAHHCDRRHKGRSNGDPDDRAFAPADHRIGTCKGGK